MARAIFRHSLEAGHVPVRNQIRTVLEQAGFERIGTGSFEAENLSRHAITAALQQVLAILDDLPDGAMDHVWIYFDQPELDIRLDPD